MWRCRTSRRVRWDRRRGPAAVRRSRDYRGERRSAARTLGERRLLPTSSDWPRGPAAAGRWRRDRTRRRLAEDVSRTVSPPRCGGLLVQRGGYVRQIAERRGNRQVVGGAPSKQQSSRIVSARRCQNRARSIAWKSTAAYPIVAAARTVQGVDVRAAIEQKFDSLCADASTARWSGVPPFRSPRCTSSGSRSSIRRAP